MQYLWRPCGEGWVSREGRGSGSILSDFMTHILLSCCVMGVLKGDKGRVPIGLGLVSIHTQGRGMGIEERLRGSSSIFSDFATLIFFVCDGWSCGAEGCEGWGAYFEGCEEQTYFGPSGRGIGIETRLREFDFRADLFSLVLCDGVWCS